MEWIVGHDPYDEGEQGYIIHKQAPAFSAKWKLEGDGVVLAELVYSDADEEEPVAVYDFVWEDEIPSEQVFRATMAEAVEAIDRYLEQIASIAQDLNP